MNLLEAPNTYTPGTYGGWRLENKTPPKGSPFVASYFSGVVPLPRVIPTLYDARNTLWMSVTAMELESQFNHNKHARGNVVVMGAGMGVLPFNLVHNPNVNTVTIVERSESLYLNWARLTGMADWEGAEKIQLVHGDARGWRGAYDTLIADIWPDIGSEELEKDMETFRTNITFDRMMCWGAEIAFLAWCQGQDLKVANTRRADVDRWSAETGHYAWPGFLQDCIKAGRTMVQSYFLRNT